MEGGFFSGIYEGFGIETGAIIFAVVLATLLSALGLSRKKFINQAAELLSGPMKRMGADGVIAAKGLRVGAWLGVVACVAFLAWKALTPKPEVNVVVTAQQTNRDNFGPHKLSEPYLKHPTVSNAGGPAEIVLDGITVKTTDKLRILVDYRQMLSGQLLMPPITAPIADISQSIRNEHVHIHLVYPDPAKHGSIYWWGDPKKDHQLSVNNFIGSDTTIYARVTILDPDAKEYEQHIYFEVVFNPDSIRFPYPQTDPLTVRMPENDWVGQWEIEK